jgi:hypothetical protein
MRRRVHQHRFESNITNATMSTTTTTKPAPKPIPTSRARYSPFRFFLWIALAVCAATWLANLSATPASSDTGRYIVNAIYIATAFLGSVVCLAALAITEPGRQRP